MQEGGATAGCCQGESPRRRVARAEREPALGEVGRDGAVVDEAAENGEVVEVDNLGEGVAEVGKGVAALP